VWKVIEQYIRKCAAYRKNKHTFSYAKMEMEITDTPFATLDKISADCMGPLPLKENGGKIQSFV
jgi:hypothetical protein